MPPTPKRCASSRSSAWRARPSAPGSIRTSSPAACAQRVMIAMALACGPKLLHRRRTDHGARRDRAGADPRAVEDTEVPGGHGDPPHHARPRRGRGDRRPSRRDVRRTRRGACSDPGSVRAPAPPLYGGALQVAPQAGLRRAAHPHRGHRPRRPAFSGGMPLSFPAVRTRCRYARNEPRRSSTATRAGRRRISPRASTSTSTPRRICSGRGPCRDGIPAPGRRSRQALPGAARGLRAGGGPRPRRRRRLVRHRGG